MIIEDRPEMWKSRMFIVETLDTETDEKLTECLYTTAPKDVIKHVQRRPKGGFKKPLHNYCILNLTEITGGAYHDFCLPEFLPIIKDGIPLTDEVIENAPRDRIT